MTYPPISLKVWGDFACFTRAEMHTERVTYEVPTPSAARGILEAIFWHKPMRWRIREIRILKPVRHFSILRNEVKSKMSERSDGLSITDDRAQRHSLILRDVSYVITADAHVPPGTLDSDGRPADAAKYRDQFRRRVERGQCFHRPYLGCREFAADFGPVTGGVDEVPEEINAELGTMLFDMDFTVLPPRPIFFQAKLVDGVLHVPQEPYEERQQQNGAQQ
jgi:CRISPR-associated protein Cas5d